MPHDIDAMREKDRRANRAIGLSFFGALVAILPLNKYLLFPVAERITGAPDALGTSVLAGAIGGAFFGGLIWLIGRRLTRHRREGGQA